MRIRDWSSDVCSSDLKAILSAPSRTSNDETVHSEMGSDGLSLTASLIQELLAILRGRLDRLQNSHYCLQRLRSVLVWLGRDEKIGRASCRARVCQYV